MNPEPDQVESLFAAVLGKPAAERAAFLDQSCAGNAALRQRVEALLKANAEAIASDDPDLIYLDLTEQEYYGQPRNMEPGR